MRRISLGVAVAVSGLLVGWVGQSIWRNSPDPLWAGVVVVSLLTGVVITLNPTVSRLLAAISGAR